MNKIIKIIILHSTVLIMSAHTQAKFEVLTPSVQLSNSSVPVVIELGQAMSQKRFEKMIAFLQQKAVKNTLDFCVGILEDNEQVLNVKGIQYRLFKNKIAVEQIIFQYPTQNIQAKYANQIFSSQTTIQEIKKLNVEKQIYLEKGEVVDEFNHQHYGYSKFYVLREQHMDDLVFAYFAGEKLLALRYVVQC